MSDPPALASAALGVINTFDAINFADLGSAKAGSESTYTQGENSAALSDLTI
jgi:hypothetical protein